MIAILHDGVSIDIPFRRILNKFSRDMVYVINIHSLDFVTDFGLHISPSYISLVRSLIPKEIRAGGGKIIYRLFKKLGLEIPNITDLDISISFIMTLWLSNGRPLTEFYRKMNDALGLEYNLLPLFEIPPLLKFVLDDGSEINYLELEKLKNYKKITSFKYDRADKVRLADETKKILEESNLILLFQVSPLTIYCLKLIGSIRKVLENFKGSVIYLLPNKLNRLDKTILRILDYETNVHGLLQFTQEQIDAVIFNEQDKTLIKNFEDIKLAIYPMSYEFKTVKDFDNFVQNLLKLAGSSEFS